MRSDLSDDAAPQRIVQIQNEALAHLSQRGQSDIDDALGHLGEKIHTEDSVRIDVHRPVPGGGTTGTILEGGKIQDERVGELPGEIHQAEVDLTNLIGERVLRLVCVVPKDCVFWFR